MNTLLNTIVEQKQASYNGGGIPSDVKFWCDLT